jgi:excinuclease ABC subunit C
VNLFHLRGGRVVDRRDFYWEDLVFEPAEFLSACCSNNSISTPPISPRAIRADVDFEDRAVPRTFSASARRSEPPRNRVEILMPQRGAKHAFLELVEKNARHSFEQRFRVLKPSSKAIVDALEQALSLPEPPRRIESFDISHLQGSDTVASMVVWEDGRMKKSDYRKFIIRGEWGNDDFASMREYRTQISPSSGGKKPFEPDPIDRLGYQLHAASLEKLEVINQLVGCGCQTGRNRPRPRAGGSADSPGTSFTHPSFNSADSRRNSQVCGSSSPGPDKAYHSDGPQNIPG